MQPETPEAVNRRVAARHVRLELETRARKLGEQIARGEGDWVKGLDALESEAARAGLVGARRWLSEWVLLGVRIEHDLSEEPSD